MLLNMIRIIWVAGIIILIQILGTGYLYYGQKSLTFEQEEQNYCGPIETIISQTLFLWLLGPIRIKNPETSWERYIKDRRGEQQWISYSKMLALVGFFCTASLSLAHAYYGIAISFTPLLRILPGLCASFALLACMPSLPSLLMVPARRNTLRQYYLSDSCPTYEHQNNPTITTCLSETIWLTIASQCFIILFSSLPSLAVSISMTGLLILAYLFPWFKTWYYKDLRKADNAFADKRLTFLVNTPITRCLMQLQTAYRALDPDREKIIKNLESLVEGFSKGAGISVFCAGTLETRDAPSELHNILNKNVASTYFIPGFSNLTVSIPCGQDLFKELQKITQTLKESKHNKPIILASYSRGALMHQIIRLWCHKNYPHHPILNLFLDPIYDRADRNFSQDTKNNILKTLGYSPPPQKNFNLKKFIDDELAASCQKEDDQSIAFMPMGELREEMLPDMPCLQQSKVVILSTYHSILYFISNRSSRTTKDDCAARLNGIDETDGSIIKCGRFDDMFAGSPCFTRPSKDSPHAQAIQRLCKKDKNIDDVTHQFFNNPQTLIAPLAR
jgi:hypothetical protein